MAVELSRRFAVENVPAAGVEQVVEADAAECLAADGVRGGDALLVKGSNSVGLGAIVRSLAAREQ